MYDSTINAKIGQLLEKVLLSSVEKLLLLAEEGNLTDFEVELQDLGNTFLTATAEVLLTSAAEAVLPALRVEGASRGLGKFESRYLTIRLFTGRTVRIPSLYAKKIRRGYTGKRHLLSLHWGIHKQCSPRYLSHVCAMSVLSPSFEITEQLLDIQGIKYDSESIRKLVLFIATICKTRQAALSKKPDESLAGKRIVIGLDGGRTRCRQYTKKQNKAGNETYTTNWNEPKMFVIAELNDEGRTVKENVIYGTMFDVDDIFELLASHLVGLDITLAKHIQIAADGAVWIWNRTQELLVSLGVAATKITETLDYYHATQHLHDLIKRLPKRKAKQENLLATMKDLLWNGKTAEIAKQFNTLFTKKTKEIKRDIHYFIKNKDRMQYADFQNNKLVLGSGIIESGIRRVINLRFKNTSSFWKKENAEGLFFLRASFLAGRWNNIISKINDFAKGDK